MKSAQAAVPLIREAFEVGDFGATLGRRYLESVNSLVEERCAKVDSWKNSNQRHRWLATALLDTEPRLRRVKGYRHLPQMRQALRRELGLEEKSANREAA